MSAPYRQSASMFDREEIDAAKAVLDSGFMTMGKNVEAFERAFAEWVGAPHAVMVNSGSSANLLAVDAMLRRTRAEAPWRAGDEVLVPALAWPTTVWPLVQLGLVPVFVDVDPTTLALSLESAGASVSPKTKGMMLIHVQGLVPDMQPYVDFCRMHGIDLLEDSCETLGAHSGGKHTGMFGKMGTFSCYFSHQICTIEGGVIVTSDQALCDDLRSARSHGWIRDRSDREFWATSYSEIPGTFMFVAPGYNVRPTDIQGAIGCVQVKKLDVMLQRREELAVRVSDIVTKRVPWLSLVGRERLPEWPRGRRERTNSWMSMMFVLEPDAPVDRATVQSVLSDHQVESRPIIAGNLTRHPGAKNIVCRKAKSLARADLVFERGLMVGCHPYPASGSVQTLVEAIEALGKL